MLFQCYHNDFIEVKSKGTSFNRIEHFDILQAISD